VSKKVLKFVHCIIFNLSLNNIPSSPFSHYFYAQSRQVYYVDHIYGAVSRSHNLGHTCSMFFHLYVLSMFVIPIKLHYLGTQVLGLITICHLGVRWAHMAAGDFSSLQQTVTQCQQVKLLDTSHNFLQSLHCLLLLYLYMLGYLKITSIAKV
jgi:hypothetical protein